MGCVVSVEVHTFTIAGGATSGSSNLGKGQVLANCVPFGASVMTAPATDLNNETIIDFSFESGPDRIVATRGLAATEEIECVVYVVEFDPAVVEVNSGTFSLGTSDTPSIGSTVVVNDTFVIATWLTTDTTDDWTSANVRYRVASTTGLEFLRTTNNGTLSGHWWTATALNGCWDVQHLTDSFISTDEQVVTTIGSAVDTDRSFVIGTWSTDLVDDAVRDGIWDIGISSSSQVTSDRGAGLTITAGAGDFMIQVIQLATTTGDVQRGQFDLGASPTDTATITAVDLTLAMALAGSEMNFSQGDGFGSGNKARCPVVMTFNSSTEILGDRSAATGASLIKWQVVQWFEGVSRRRVVLIS